MNKFIYVWKTNIQFSSAQVLNSWGDFWLWLEMKWCKPKAWSSISCFLPLWKKTSVCLTTMMKQLAKTREKIVILVLIRDYTHQCRKLKSASAACDLLTSFSDLASTTNSALQKQILGKVDTILRHFSREMHATSDVFHANKANSLPFIPWRLNPDFCPRSDKVALSLVSGTTFVYIPNEFSSQANYGVWPWFSWHHTQL